LPVGRYYARDLQRRMDRTGRHRGGRNFGSGARSRLSRARAAARTEHG
jgi:hypothetical protein